MLSSSHCIHCVQPEGLGFSSIPGTSSSPSPRTTLMTNWRPASSRGLQPLNRDACSSSSTLRSWETGNPSSCSATFSTSLGSPRPTFHHLFSGSCPSNVYQAMYTWSWPPLQTICPLWNLPSWQTATWTCHLLSGHSHPNTPSWAWSPQDRGSQAAVTGPAT